MDRPRNKLNIKPVLTAMLLSLLVAACATSISYDDYLAQYLGVSEEQLTQAMGQPQSREQQNGQTYLTYMTQGQRNVMVSPAIYEPYFDGRNVQHRIVSPERWTTERTRCETIFIIEQDVLIQYLYSGNGCMAPTLR